MYRELVDLKNQFQDERTQLKTDVKELKIILENPDLAPFDELYAASRMTEAKSKDQLEGLKTADKLIKEIEKERAELLTQNEAFTLKANEAKQVLPSKEARLLSVENEINSLEWKIKALIDAEVKKRLVTKTKKYRRLALDLLNTLIEIDALNAVITENPHENPAKYVLQVDSLPDAKLDDFDNLHPWQWQPSGKKLVFPREAAFPAVHNKHLSLIEEIKGNLYGK